MAKENSEQIVKGVHVGTELRKVPLEKIFADESWNSRQTYENIPELAADIQSNTLISPLTVARLPKDHPQAKRYDWFLVAGFRRRRAIETLAMADVEVKVVPWDPVKNAVLNGQENMSREDVGVFEIGAWARRLCQAHGLSGAELGKMLNYSKQYINFALKVAALPDQVHTEAALLAKMTPPKTVPQGLLRRMCYQCDDDAEKQLAAWAEFMAGLESEGTDSETGGSSNGAPKRPSRKTLEDWLNRAQQWGKVNPEQYDPHVLKAIRQTLGAVLGIQNRAGNPVKFPLKELPKVEAEVEE